MPPQLPSDGETHDAVADARDHHAEGRDAAADVRDAAAVDRDTAAGHRDDRAEHRDALADERDRLAETTLDEAGHTMTPELADQQNTARAARAAAATDRDHARTDRAAGAQNRVHAGGDRDQAGSDRTDAGHDRVAGGEDRSSSARYRRASDLDPLTGALHRGIGHAALAQEMDRATRLGHPLAVAYLDVDQMKAVNDTGGHRAGDQLLRDVVHALRAAVRPHDLVIRQGGDEFLCVLPNTATPDAHSRMTQVNRHLAALDTPASVTAGIAQMHPGDTPEQLINRADDNLYQQKATPHP